MSKDASGQVDPKKTNGEKRVKRGRLHFTEEEVTRQAGEQASGQVGPKDVYKRQLFLLCYNIHGISSTGNGASI